MANTTPPNPHSTPVELLNFAFPFRKKGQGNADASADFTDEHDFHKLLKKEPSGCYSVSSKGMWHGGIHVTEAGAGQALDLKNGVRCMADGEVVAWRVDRTYPISEIPAQNGKPAISAPYSTGFALVRHTMEFPKGTTLKFFSLYMHLQDLAGYEICETDTSVQKPAYWSPQCRVTEFAKDKPHAGPRGQAAPAEQQGLRVRATKLHGTIIGILPRASQVSIGKREGDWGQIKDMHGAQLFAPTVGEFVAPNAATNGWIFLGKEGGHPVVEDIMPDSSLDRVVVPSTPFPIKAGELIGYLGRYDSLSQPAANRMVHIEVFCDDSVKSFIEQGRAWIRSNGAHPNRWKPLGLSSDPTILRVAKNTTLYGKAHERGQDAKQTGVILIAAFTELARLGAPEVDADPGPDGLKLNWWHVDSADVRGKPINGWVREQSFEGGRVTREFAQKWVDFQTFEDAHDPTHTMFATPKAFVDYASGADVPDAGALGKLSPLMATIYRALYTTGDGSQAADELCVAAHDPWTSVRMSRLIIKHESEWANPGKWKQLIAEIEKRTGPQVQHEAEQKRIDKLVWWDEVKAGLADLPASDVFHIHPIGLVGNFRKGGFQFTLAMMEHLFPRANGPELQDVVDELNAHISLYKLDTGLRRGHFFAQVKQETGAGLAIHNEILDYSSTALTGGLFSYFTAHPHDAQLYGRTNQHPADQAAIANHAYAGQDGNGDIASGDGYLYRGRGMIQLTHRGGYRRFTQWHRANGAQWPQDRHIDFEGSPEAVGQVKYAVRSACYFWVMNNLYTIADGGLAQAIVDDISGAINPGLFHGRQSAQKAESINGRRVNFNDIERWGGLK
ncbi:chitinase [Burkholderia sp. L27(2015)]|uniref:glycoside hydrolase family 19 protein n=1 Tax=Burkholderia sp. L27(2015) TaxID=1641858 RepID=UPI001C20A907|nr:chitinase [Burkholderia sp. L27(2015)]